MATRPAVSTSNASVVSTALQPRAIESPASPAGASSPDRSRRWTWPLCLTATVLAAGAVPAEPVRDLLAQAITPAAHLERPLWYVVFAPLSDVLDMLTLFSLQQHIAFALSLCAAYACWRLVSRTLSDRTRRRARASEVRLGVSWLVATACAYAAMIAMPRPMARLALDDPAQIAIDFHSHTNASHDARAGFTPERNRAWHDAAGYDAAYVSDHHSFRGAVTGSASNPRAAGGVTMLLPALEAVYQGEHVIVVGSSHGPGTAPVRQWADSRLPGDAGAGLILTIPGTVAAFRRTGVRQTRVLGIELSDACPRGLGETDAKSASILALATTLGTALLTGSDNHGWGHTAVAWSVMTIPGWRGMSADTLDAHIIATLARDGTRAVSPLARNRVRSADFASAATIAPDAMWMMLRTASWPERLSWIAWIWMASLLAAGYRHRRMRARLRLISAADALTH